MLSAFGAGPSPFASRRIAPSLRVSVFQGATKSEDRPSRSPPRRGHSARVRRPGAGIEGGGKKHLTPLDRETRDADGPARQEEKRPPPNETQNNNLKHKKKRKMVPMSSQDGRTPSFNRASRTQLEKEWREDCPWRDSGPEQSSEGRGGGAACKVSISC